MENIIEKMQEKGVIVYGGGITGKQIIKKLKKNHIFIISVWDENAKNMKNVDKIELPDYDYIDKDVFIIICISSIKVCEEVEEKLRKNGFSNIFYSNSKMISKFYCNCEKERFDIRECNQCISVRGGLHGICL